MQGYSITETARLSLAAARQECSALKHDYIRPEHILLGLASSDDRTLLQVWSGLNIDPVDIRRATLARLSPGRADNDGPDVPYSSGARRVLEFAMHEASALEADDLGPTYILLGIARLQGEAAASVLQEWGATTDRIRTVLAELRPDER